MSDYKKFFKKILKKTLRNLKNNKYPLLIIVGIIIFITIIIQICKVADNKKNLSVSNTVESNFKNNRSTLESETTVAVKETMPYTKDTKDDVKDIMNETTSSLEESINFNSELPYLIKVNTATNFVVVYGRNYEDAYDIPYKAFICSTGKEGCETPQGTFEIYQRYDWCRMVDSSYSQYAIRFNGSIMFHSVPYYTLAKNNLETEEYNKLGTSASLGCVRLTVEDAKWIYDNCPDGTIVEVYSDTEEELPIDAKIPQKLDVNDEYSSWDPTDPDSNNPWIKGEDNGN